MIEVMIALIESNPILVFTLRLRLGQDGVVLAEERRGKPAKHVHDPQVVFGMCVAG